MTSIDLRATRSHRGGHWFDPSIAHQVSGYVDLLKPGPDGQRRRKRVSGNDKVRRNVATLVDAPADQEGCPSKSLTFGQAVALIRAARSYGLHAYVVLSLW